MLKLVSMIRKLQLQTADKPMAPHGRATQQSRDTKKTHQAFLNDNKRYIFPQNQLNKRGKFSSWHSLSIKIKKIMHY